MDRVVVVLVALAQRQHLVALLSLILVAEAVDHIHRIVVAQAAVAAAVLAGRLLPLWPGRQTQVAAAVAARRVAAQAQQAALAS